MWRCCMKSMRDICNAFCNICASVSWARSEKSSEKDDSSSSWYSENVALGGEEEVVADVVGKMGYDFRGDVPEDVPGRSSAKDVTRGCFPVIVVEDSSTVLNVRDSLQCDDGPAPVGAPSVIVVFVARRRLRRRSGRCCCVYWSNLKAFTTIMT